MTVSYFTVDEVAAKLAVNRAQVHRLIRNGTLRAVNISSGKGQRASWRVPQEALDQLERCRSNRIVPTTKSSSTAAATPRTFY